MKKIEWPKPIQLKPISRPGDQGAVKPDFTPYDEVACQAIGLSSPKQAKTSQGVFHFLGHFDIQGSTDAMDRVQLEWSYRNRNRDRLFYSYREYLDALRRVTTIKGQIERRKKWEYEETERYPPELPDDEDIEFVRFYSLDLHTPDRDGYLNYLHWHAPELYDVLGRKVPVYVKEDPHRPHTYVLGATRSGKTELVKLLIHSFVRTKPTYGAVVVLDPASDFVRQVARWREFAGTDQLIYFRPNAIMGMSPVINPFKISGVEVRDYSPATLEIKDVVSEELIEGFQRVIADSGGGSQLTLPMETLLKPTVMALLDYPGLPPDFPGATLRDLATFMNDNINGDLVNFAKSLTHHKGMADFFEHEFGLGVNTPTKDAIRRKLSYLLLRPKFRNATCGKNTIDLARAIDEKKVILFDLGRGAMGKRTGEAFAKLIVAMLLGIAARRAELPKHKRVPCSIVIDECHNYVTKSMEDILKEAGKYQMFLTLCQQFAGDGMNQDLYNAVKTNTNIHFTGGAPKGGVEKNANLFGLDPKDVQTLHLGEFYARVRREGSAFRFQVRDNLIDNKNSVSDAMWRRRVKQQVRAHYRASDPDAAGAGAPPADAGQPTVKRRRRTQV